MLLNNLKLTTYITVYLFIITVYIDYRQMSLSLSLSVSLSLNQTKICQFVVFGL